MDFLRSRTGAAVCALGLLTALSVFLLMPFSDGTGVGAKLFFSVVLGGFAAFGAWSFAGIPALVRDVVGMVRGWGKPRPGSNVHHQGPLPELSPRKQGEVRRIVRVMAEHGLFVPEVPDAALLFAGVAEQDFSVKPDSVIYALAEVDYYHPGTDAERWMANLVLHSSKGEQDEAVHITDLARLTANLLDVRDISVRRGATSGHGRAVPIDIAMTVNGEAVALSYMGDAKYLSTHIHHALATRLRDGASGKRLAWLWDEQGAWISLVDDGAVEALNAALKLGDRSRCAWAWMDEGEPMAAGQTG